MIHTTHRGNGWSGPDANGHGTLAPHMRLQGHTSPIPLLLSPVASEHNPNANTHNRLQQQQPQISNASNRHRSNQHHNPSQPNLLHPHRQPNSQRQSRVIKTPLEVLEEEENLLLRRKNNIARFGATWIRPPGIAKTLQGTMDEAAERAEQEAMAMREAAAMEMRRAQEMSQTQPGGTEVMEGVVDLEGEEGQRDLDDEVPEAEGFEYDEDEDDDVEDEEEDEGDEVTNISAQQQRDLDASIPEADSGSYEHTDTEVEDSSSDVGFPAHARSISAGGGRYSTDAFHRTRHSGAGIPITNALVQPNVMDGATGEWLGRYDGPTDGRSAIMREGDEGREVTGVETTEASMLRSSPFDTSRRSRSRYS